MLAGGGCSSGGTAAGSGGQNGSGGSGTGGAGTGGANAGSGGNAGGSGGSAGTGGQGMIGNDAGATGGASATDASDGNSAADAGGDRPIPAGHFSFFMTSLETMRRLAKSQDGFGGDLRYGQTDGLTGADRICSDTADFVLPGAGAKGWHAFLSVAQGPGGGPVNAIDRIGDGPWYDRLGRLLAMNKAALLGQRPTGADAIIINDLPNEYGVPNHRPDPAMPEVDNHHVLTGSDAMGRLYTGAGLDSTCKNWTSAAHDSTSRPRIGFSWPEDTRLNWLSGQDEGGCGAGVNLIQTGGSTTANPIVGSGGGYGSIYCFAGVP
ncbi:MAG TPA: hypothetical protein VGL59_22225 [Polyangia bacterium]